MFCGIRLRTISQETLIGVKRIVLSIALAVTIVVGRDFGTSGNMYGNYPNQCCPRPGTPNGINSLTHGRYQFSFRKVIFKLTLVNGGWGIPYEIALRGMPQDLTDDKSTLGQVMAWCRKASAITWANVDPDLCCQMASLGPMS